MEILQWRRHRGGNQAWEKTTHIIHVQKMEIKTVGDVSIERLEHRMLQKATRADQCGEQQEL